MAKVLGIGGIFFKSENPQELAQWYKKYLMIELNPDFQGASFHHKNEDDHIYTVWSPFSHSTQYFEPSKKPFMVNFIVDDIRTAILQVQRGGATIIGDIEKHDYGYFGWFLDPEANKVELWQPLCSVNPDI